MGVEPFLVTSALDCVLAQRLARKLCDRCKEPYQPSEAELIEAGWPMEQIDGTDWPVLYRHVGCGGCGKTGYRGRFALHEVMLVTEEIEKLIIERRSTDDLKKVAVMEGMIPLRADGLRKVAAGLTSLEEVFRVVVIRSWAGSFGRPALASPQGRSAADRADTGQGGRHALEPGPSSRRVPDRSSRAVP